MANEVRPCAPRLRTPRGRRVSLEPVDLAIAAAIEAITFELLPERRLHAAARVVRRKTGGYGVKRAEHRSWPRPTLSVDQAIQVITN